MSRGCALSQQAVFTNRLAGETSPYLNQHAHNPVDWFPWGPEALQRARQMDRPIFLSIGYSACHWCHVMEHESFEDVEIARLLNEHFVSIKVDREERPDLDQIYMTAVQMLTGQGGWPMSVFLTPELKPFFAGTYFPADDRQGRPGFKRVLSTLVNWWQTRRQEIEQSAEAITAHLQTAGGVGRVSNLAVKGDWQVGNLPHDTIKNAATGLERVFDSTYGGFGLAPKFPHPMVLRFLLRAWSRSGDSNALHMVCLTLDQMAQGGIYDHLGGGFARYSTDGRWLVPHFEKMLYDNALLCPAYLEAFQATGESTYGAVVEETLGFVLREMTSPEGSFYSTLDADSDGAEGKFYVWTAREVEDVLGKELAAAFSYVYDITPEGNWEGCNILHRMKTFGQNARLLGMDEAELRRQIDSSRERLLEVRSRRVHPGRDEKVLTSWNALMIDALARAGQVLDNAEYRAAAVHAGDFLLQRMRTGNGKLLRTYSTGSVPKLNGYLEDYAFLLEALVSLYETVFEVRWIEAAIDLADVMIEQFWDEREGGFFYTGRDHEPLIARVKEAQDNAIPSGNAMAATALLRLARLTGRTDYHQKAETTLQLYQDMMARYPTAAGQMLIALDFYLGPVQEIAIVGDPAALPTQQVLRIIHKHFLPNRVVAFRPVGAPAEKLEKVIPLLAGKTAHGDVTTYVLR